MPETPEKSRTHPAKRAPEPLETERPRYAPSAVPYAELAVTSNFTFLTGASHPEEMVEQAALLGHRAAAIADTNTLAGVVRAHVAAKGAGAPLAIGSRLTFTDAPAGFSVLVFATDRASYGRLCRLLTRGRRRAPKGECHLAVHDLLEFSEGLIGVVDVPRDVGEETVELIRGLRDALRGTAFQGERRLPAGTNGQAPAGWKPGFQGDATLFLAAAREYGPDDLTRLEQIGSLSEMVGVPLVAVNSVIYHEARRKPLQDVLSCIRHGCTIDQAGFRLTAHAERHLKSPEEMLHLFEGVPWGREAVENAAAIALRASRFSLDELRYEYPHEVCPPGLTPMEYLVKLTWEGAAKRFPEAEGGEGGAPEKVRRQIEHELALIEELNYAPYFLTCYDIVVYARSQGILCQGRGAAANSAVCYCLGVTSVDPSRIDLLFERFVSRERKEPPDIDIDFEHERREEVIQYIYRKYGRDRAALTAEVITYRGRSAIREVGKALGLSLDCVDRLAKSMDWWEMGVVREDRLREMGLNPREGRLQQAIALAGELIGFPRHLSQHVGGFVLTRPLLEETVPIGNAAMDDRTMIEWDKDDIDALGILKIDVLGLGMLTAISRAFKFINQRHEGTEARRHGGGTGAGDVRKALTQKEDAYGRNQTIPGSDRMAEGDGVGEGDLSSDDTYAEGGEVLTDDSDAASGGLSSVEHRRGIWPPEHGGLHQVPSHGTGLAAGVGHSVRTGNQLGHAESRGISSGDTCRDRSGSSGSYPKSRGRTQEIRNPSCLRAFVPSCLQLHTIPPEDPRVYEMLCHADTVGIFQIESRAQMQMLPRLRPRCYYDLVIEVAIVRPGPIQGDMVHPYLRRRNGEEPVSFPDEAVRKVLEKTLGVPLFQEQAMQLAIVAAGFTPDEADQLRRAIAAWKRKGNEIYRYGQKLMDGMKARGYPAEFAERCFEQIKGFSEYGFPESHAASFALLVYVSAWLKRHHPAAFASALINSQPMGFYAPAQIVRDARDHGVIVREIDVNQSGWDCTLEESDEGTEARRHEGRDGETERRRDKAGKSRAQAQGPQPEGLIVSSRGPSGARPPEDTRPYTHDPEGVGDAPPTTWGLGGPAVRLGMRLVKGLKQADADTIADAVAQHGPFDTIDDLWRATPTVGVASLKRLAQADAFRSMGLDRQRALWAVRRLRDEALPLFEEQREEGTKGQRDKETKGQRDKGTGRQRDGETVVRLPEVRPYTAVAHDYAHTGLSLKAHPVSFVRDQLRKLRVIENRVLADERACPHGRHVTVSGLVLVRQRPGTASGIVFITIEDETGVANLIIRPKVYEKFRKALRHAVLLIARGTIERQGEVVHIMVYDARDGEETLAPPGGDAAAHTLIDGSRNFR